MNGIEVLLQEHENIEQFITATQKICCGILEGDPVDGELFQKMIEFGQTYADQHHHQKEEQILFDEMSSHLGPVAQRLIQHGMLVEHDMGRFHLNQAKEALERYLASPNTFDKLQILTELTEYTNLLERHIEKENNVAYPFGQKNLSQESLERIDRDTQAFEAQWESRRQESMAFLSKLMERVNMH